MSADSAVMDMNETLSLSLMSPGLPISTTHHSVHVHHEDSVQLAIPMEESEATSISTSEMNGVSMPFWMVQCQSIDPQQEDSLQHTIPIPNEELEVSTTMPTPEMGQNMYTSTPTPIMENQSDEPYLLIETSHDTNVPDQHQPGFLQRALTCNRDGCGTTYPSLKQVTDCIRSHGAIRCHFCLLLFESIYDLLEHINADTRSWSLCPVCHEKAVFHFDSSTHMVDCIQKYSKIQLQ